MLRHREKSIPHSARLRRPLLAAATVSALCSASLVYALPVLESSDKVWPGGAVAQAASWLAAASIVLATVAFFSRRRPADILAHDDLRTIQRLSSRDFVQLVEEGFRRSGYQVQRCERGPAKARIDLILRKADQHVLVLCRRDRTAAAQLRLLHELHAAAGDLNGRSGLVVTTQTLAPESRAYAAEHSIALIEGPALLKLVHRARGVAASSSRREPRCELSFEVLPVCAECGNPMLPMAVSPAQSHSAWACMLEPRCKSAGQAVGV